MYVTLWHGYAECHVVVVVVVYRSLVLLHECHCRCASNCGNR